MSLYLRQWEWQHPLGRLVQPWPSGRWTDGWCNTCPVRDRVPHYPGPRPQRSATSAQTACGRIRVRVRVSWLKHYNQLELSGTRQRMPFIETSGSLLNCFIASPPTSIILFLPRPVLAQVRSVIVENIAVNPLLPRKTLRSALWYLHIKTHTFTDVNAYVKKRKRQAGK